MFSSRRRRCSAAGAEGCGEPRGRRQRREEVGRRGPGPPHARISPPSCEFFSSPLSSSSSLSSSLSSLPSSPSARKLPFSFRKPNSRRHVITDLSREGSRSLEPGDGSLAFEDIPLRRRASIILSLVRALPNFASRAPLPLPLSLSLIFSRSPIRSCPRDRNDDRR